MGIAMPVGKTTHSSTDFNVRFGIDSTLYYETRAETLLGKLSRPSTRPELEGQNHGTGKNVAATDIISRKKITTGDEVRFTLREAATGLPAYGDLSPNKGGYGAYRHQNVVINKIKTAAFPISGEMDRQMVRESVANLPQEVRDDAKEWMADEIDHEFIRSLIFGASKSLLAPAIAGGKEIVLGGGTAGVAQMCRNFYTNDSGLVTFSDVQATYNTAVNVAVQGIDAATDDQINLTNQRYFRRLLDKMLFAAPQWNGVKSKNKIRAVHLCDPAIVERMAIELELIQRDVLPRSEDSAVLDSYNPILYKNMLYVPVPQLEAYRPAYDAGLGRPRFGADLDKDPRTFTTSSKMCLMITLGGRAVLEAFNADLKLTMDADGHQTYMDVVAHIHNGFVRAEWWKKDGTTGAAACKNYSSIVSVFYDPDA